MTVLRPPLKDAGDGPSPRDDGLYPLDDDPPLETTSCISRRRSVSRGDGLYPETASCIRRRRTAVRRYGPYPVTTVCIPRRRTAAADDGLYLRTTGCICGRRAVSRDDEPPLERTVCIPGGRSVVAGGSSSSGDTGRRLETTEWNRVEKRRGARRARPPVRENYFTVGGLGETGVGVPGDCGCPGAALRVRPRNGCRPNSASFSSVMP
jgi:hypothetical protein